MVAIEGDSYISCRHSPRAVVKSAGLQLPSWATIFRTCHHLVTNVFRVGRSLSLSLSLLGVIACVEIGETLVRWFGGSQRALDEILDSFVFVDSNLLECVKKAGFILSFCAALW